MSLPGEDVVRSMSSAETSKEDAGEAKRCAAVAKAGEEEVAADEDDPLISATSSMPMAAPDVAFTNKEDRAAAKSSKKKKKKKRRDAKQADNSLKVPAPPPKSGGKHRKKSKMQPPPRAQPNYTYDDPGMGRYLDDAFRWNAETAMKPLTLPSTFIPRPEFVRRLSHSMQSPHDFDLIRSKPARSHRGAIGDTHSGGDIGDRDSNFVGIDIEDADQRPAWHSMFRRDKRGGKTRRVCEKDGTANVKYKNISEKRRRYVYDIYTTLVDSSWTSSLFLFSMSFYITWLGYAIAYWIICYIHGDFEPNLPKDYTPCILEVYDFASAFLFSLETQHTIGYGSRQSTTECVDLMIICSTQSVIGCLIQAFVVGVVFAKLSVPNRRAKTVVFSKNGVICERDKKLCLQFRVGDMRNDSYIVGAAISAKVIRRRVSAEGEMYHDVTPLIIVPDSSNEPCMFLIWPFTVMHVIDKESPFYNLSAPEIASDKFEVHLVLEGTIESTSMTFQARTSYLPNEIMWGHRFEPMMIFRKDHNKYQVNFSAFNSTYEVDTPLCSSKQLAAFYKSKAKCEKATGHPRSIIGAARPKLPTISGSPSTSLQQAKQKAAAIAATRNGQFYGYQAPLAGEEDEDDNGDDSNSSNDSESESSSVVDSDASSASSDAASSIAEEATAAARLSSLGTEELDVAGAGASSSNGANAKGGFQ